MTDQENIDNLERFARELHDPERLVTVKSGELLDVIGKARRGTSARKAALNAISSLEANTPEVSDALLAAGDAVQEALDGIGL